MAESSQFYMLKAALEEQELKVTKKYSCAK
jgi:hypothetical protein